MVYGWAGKILRVDLSSGRVSKTSSTKYTKMLLGARGTNAKLLFEESKAGQSPFDPENPIIIGAGAAAATGAFGAAKLEVTSRYAEEEPDTLLGNVIIGGSFAPEMKFAGFDNIVIKGRTEKPVYLYVENENVELRDAAGVWGKGIFKTNDIIREEVGDPEVKILAIGPAGEKLVRMATVEHEYRSGSAMGAVFGAKNLKAVVVRGTKAPEVYDPEGILKLNEQLLQRIKETDPLEEMGGAHYATAIKYWFEQLDVGVIGHYEGHEKSDWPAIEKTYGVPFVQEFLKKRRGCFACPISCMGIYMVPGVGTGLMRCFPFWWTWKVMITDLRKTFEANLLCADYGIESGDVATWVSWLMMLYDKGIITPKDTDGISMERGSAEALFQTIHKIGNRKGFGDVLAEGALKFAKKLGPKAERWLMQRRGLAPRTVDVRTTLGTALGEAVAARGNSHRSDPMEAVAWPRSWPDEELKKAQARAKKNYGSEKAVVPWEYEGKPRLLVEAERNHAILDTLGICVYCVIGATEFETKYDAIGALPAPHTYELALLSATTGIKWTEKMLLAIADRVINLERAFNVREGLTRKDDTIPERWFTDPIPSGPHKGRKIDRAKFEKMKDEYYRLRGWDVETGWPTRQTLEKLGLKDVADNLDKLRRLPKLKKA